VGIGNANTPRRYAVRGKLAIEGSLVEGAVVVEDNRIIELSRLNGNDNLPPDVIEADIVSPGFIDLQVNGGFGVEVGTDEEPLGLIEAHLPASGVTAYLPTAISSIYSFYERFLKQAIDQRYIAGARRIGFHLEGPFLSPQRIGAHPISAIQEASDKLLDLFQGCKDVALVTMAPEEPGNLDRIRRLVDAGVIVSLGHTNATIEELSAGADAGATMATHLFNAMSPFNHRAPGAIGGALTDDRLVAGLIADGVHAHPRAIDLAVRAKGSEGVALVTDMMAAAGMPPGEYTLGGQTVETDGISVRLPDGTLAGSVLLMDAAVRNLASFANISIAQALRTVTEVPARLLNRSDIGTLRPGAFADFALLDPQGQIERTIVNGETVFQRSNDERKRGLQHC
jgi:N-acetylglucosamine-6-phosphate deacetylase